MKKLLCLLLVFLMAFGMVGCGNSDSTDGQVSNEDTTPTFRSVIEFDELEITFGEAVEYESVSNQFADLNGSEVVKVPITVKNIGSEVNGLNMFYVTEYGSKGVALEGVSAYFDDDIRWVAGSDSLRPDASTSAFMYFLYDGDGDYYISFDNWSEKIEVKLPISK